MCPALFTNNCGEDVLSAFAHRLWSICWPVGLAAAGLYVALAAVLWVLQPRLIYFPQRDIIATPDRIGFSYEAVAFEAADGVRLSGWFVPAGGPPRGVILFCHGNAGNLSHRLESIRLFHGLGLSTFIFDYRGYGQSQGRTTERGTYLDAEAAWRYLVQEREVAPTEIIVFGRSLGGAIAAWLAQSQTPRALIVESTFTSVPDMGAQLYPYFPVRFLSRFDYNAMGYLRKVDCPVLVVHSRDDEMIPFSHGRRLFEAANEPKALLEITGTHNEGFVTSAERYQDGLVSFISRYAGD